MIKSTLSIIFSNLFVSALGQKNDLFNKENTELYANHLFINQQYDLAKDEYHRLNYFDAQNAFYQSRLLQTYKFTNAVEEGVGVANKFYASDSLFPDTISRVFLNLLLESDYRHRTLMFLNANKSLAHTELLFYKAANYGLDYQIGFMKQTLALTKDDSSQSIKNLKTILIADSLFNPKSKFIAVSLSTILPGMGKVYLGDWKDGLASFVYTSMCAWQSYRGFDQKGIKSAYGWIFAGVGTGFYLGNIYGTLKSVRIRREKHQLDIKNQFKNVATTGFY